MWAAPRKMQTQKSVHLKSSNLITSHLKLNPIGILSHIQWAEGIHHDCLDESFHPLVKIPCRCVSVFPHKFMGTGAGGQEISNRHSIDEDFFLPGLVFILDLLIL